MLLLWPTSIYQSYFLLLQAQMISRSDLPLTPGVSAWLYPSRFTEEQNIIAAEKNKATSISELQPSFRLYLTCIKLIVFKCKSSLSFNLHTPCHRPITKTVNKTVNKISSAFQTFTFKEIHKENRPKQSHQPPIWIRLCLTNSIMYLKLLFEYIGKKNLKNSSTSGHFLKEGRFWYREEATSHCRYTPEYSK